MLQETPASLIHSAIDSFEIEPDLHILRRIEEAIQKAQNQRNLIIETHENKINQLTREYETLLAEIEALTSASGVSFEMARKFGSQSMSTTSIEEDNIFKVFQKKSIELDGLKVLLAKTLNDLESQINLMNIIILKLTESLDQLETKKERVINDNFLNNPDSKIMKINLYKSLGILIENFDQVNENGDGKDRILIYNRETDLTNILNVSDKYSDYFITNHIWDSL